MISVAMAISPKDNEFFWEESLTSIAKQSEKPDEIVCYIDGALSQNQQKLLKKICTKQFKFIQSNITRGLGYALNTAVNYCSNELIARFDSDDICLVDRLAHQHEFMRNNQNIDILGTNAIEIDENGIQGKARKMPELNSEIRKKIWKCPLIHPSVMYKKSKIQTVGNYNKKLARRQDYELWFRCFEKKLNFHNLQMYGIKYRLKAPQKKVTLQSIHQAKIGIKYCIRLKLGVVPIMGCLFPIISELCPNSIIFNKIKDLHRY